MSSSSLYLPYTWTLKELMFLVSECTSLVFDEELQL